MRSIKLALAASAATLGLIGAQPAHAQLSTTGAGVGSPVCAGVLVKTDFVNGAYCKAGARYASFAALSGSAVSRSSTETCQWVDGHLTYAAANQLCVTDRGAGIWESRTNLTLNSLGYATTAVSGSPGTVTANYAAGPDGTTTASRYQWTGGSTWWNAPVLTVSAATYTASVYVKINTALNSTLSFGMTDGANSANLLLNSDLSFNSSTNAGTASAPAGVAIEKYTNGWARVRFTTTFSAGSAAEHLSIGPASNATGDILVADAQLEQGAFVTPYIATTTAAATRAADSVTVALNLTAPFTLGAKWAGTTAANSSYPNVIQVDDGTNNNRVMLFVNQNTNTLGLGAVVGGTSVGGATLAAQTAGAAQTVYARAAAGSYGASLNHGSAVDATGAQTTPAVSKLRLGASLNTNNYLNSYLTSAVVYPVGYADTQLGGLP